MTGNPESGRAGGAGGLGGVGAENPGLCGTDLGRV